MHHIPCDGFKWLGEMPETTSVFSTSTISLQESVEQPAPCASTSSAAADDLATFLEFSSLVEEDADLVEVDNKTRRN
jgi:hypothetical protein